MVAPEKVFMNGVWLVVMGVSGCGKSSLGAALAVGFGPSGWVQADVNWANARLIP